MRASQHVVAQQLGEGAVLIHLQTNQIYELNRTGLRIWELFTAGLDRAAIQSHLEEEFDVPSPRAAREIDSLLSMLEAERLIATSDALDS
jgi:hypothetical protein